MSNTIVHIQTEIRTIFGVVDENHNVIKTIPVEGVVTILNKDKFSQVAEDLIARRQSIEENVNTPDN